MSKRVLVAVLDEIGRTFDKLGDEYFRQRKDDILDVGKRVMRHLLGAQRGPARAAGGALDCDFA